MQTIGSSACGITNAPGLADAEDVVAGFTPKEGVTYSQMAMVKETASIKFSIPRRVECVADGLATRKQMLEKYEGILSPLS